MSFSASKSTLLLLLTLILITDAETASALCISAITHELGHLIAMRLCKIKPKRLSMSPFGFCIEYDDRYTKYYHDMLIALGGPIMNFAIICSFSKIGQGYFTQAVIATSALMGCFNLLPIGALDGGRALYALLCIVFTPDKAEMCVNITGFLSAMAVSALEVILYFASGENLSMLFSVIWLICVVWKAKMV